MELYFETEDFDAFMKEGKLKGFGSTDFRPVFAYVEKLAAEQPEMTNAFIMAYAQYLLTKREAEA